MWTTVVVVWVLLAGSAAVLLGRAICLADRRERELTAARPHDVPDPQPAPTVP